MYIYSCGEILVVSYENHMALIPIDVESKIYSNYKVNVYKYQEGYFLRCQSSPFRTLKYHRDVIACAQFNIEEPNVTEFNKSMIKIVAY